MKVIEDRRKSERVILVIADDGLSRQAGLIVVDRSRPSGRNGSIWFETFSAFWDSLGGMKWLTADICRLMVQVTKLRLILKSPRCEISPVRLGACDSRSIVGRSQKYEKTDPPQMAHQGSLLLEVM